MLVIAAYATLRLLLARGSVSLESVESLILKVTQAMLGSAPASLPDEVREDYEELKRLLGFEECRVEGDAVALSGRCRDFAEEWVGALGRLKSAMAGSLLCAYLTEIDRLLDRSPSGGEIAGALAMPDPSYVYNILSRVGAGRGRSGSNEKVCPEVVKVLSSQGVVVSGSDLHRRYYSALYACSKQGWLQRVRLKNRYVCRKVLDEEVCGKVLFYVDRDTLAEFLTSKLKVSRKSPQTLKRLATVYLSSMLPPEVASAIRRVYKQR